MAVDVPASFIAQAKTPPRYPPANPRYQTTLSTFSPRGAEHNSSSSSRHSTTSNTNGSIGMAPPPTGSRDHLKIEKDGRLVNRALGPQLPDKDGRLSSGRHTGTDTPDRPPSLNGCPDYSPLPNGKNGILPSKEQYDRIAK